MYEVSWTDDSTPIRLFKVGVRICDHFSAAMATSSGNDLSNEYARLDDLNTRMHLIREDFDVSGYIGKVQRELEVNAGDPLSDSIRAALATPYDYGQRLRTINEISFAEVRKCIQLWGGPKAQKRFGALAPLPMRCGAGGDNYIKCSFDRDIPLIDVSPGKTETLLRECLVFEFSLFHEYLSHAFPDWKRDEADVSEAWLLALEMQWFKSEYTALDSDVLLQVWGPRLMKDRKVYWAADWLLKRCDSRRCVARFLLEFVASWSQFDPDDASDFLSLLTGVANKAGMKLGANSSDKQKKTVGLLNKLLCTPCESQAPVWDFDKMRMALAREMDKYS